MKVHTISSINQLADDQKKVIYTKLIPKKLLERFHLSSTFTDQDGQNLLQLYCSNDRSTVEMKLFHEAGFIDPILHGQIADTLNGQIHILLYILNDPYSPRYKVDCMPNGTATRFGTHFRNIPAEISALQHGLAPGQIRKGLRLLGEAIKTFEFFVTDLGHELFFVEPLYYHNAVIFERYGFAYQKGRKFMERIQAGFSKGGDLLSRLDDTNPFRSYETPNSIRLRSWAIHDNILGEQFTDVTMYKWINRSFELKTAGDTPW
jgi:hypothetical protein